jgi:hypothetical protein
MASSRVIGGKMPGTRRASMVLPKRGNTGRDEPRPPGILEHIETLEMLEPRAETRSGWAERLNLCDSGPPPCACGCGGKVAVRAQHRTKGVPRYIHGHHPNPVRRAYAKVRAQGYVMVGEACRELGIGETTFRRFEAKGIVAQAQRIVLMPGRLIRVLTKADLRAARCAIEHHLLAERRR